MWHPSVHFIESNQFCKEIVSEMARRATSRRRFRTKITAVDNISKQDVSQLLYEALG